MRTQTETQTWTLEDVLSLGLTKGKAACEGIGHGLCHAVQRHCPSPKRGIRILGKT